VGWGEGGVVNDVEDPTTIFDSISGIRLGNGLGIGFVHVWVGDADNDTDGQCRSKF
jgi:hypothetical protein